jgi:probable rRNA maturation factor
MNAQIELEKIILIAQKKLKRKKIGAAVELVSAPEMTRLNSKFRKKKKATDVLSFPAPKIFQKNGFLGDLVICTPVMKRQARAHGHSERKELQILLTHGLLHLLGFDHEKGEKEAAEMRKWEAKILNHPSGLIERTQSGKHKE